MTIKFDRYTALEPKAYRGKLSNWEEIYEPGFNKTSQKFDGPNTRRLKFTFDIKTKTGVVTKDLKRSPAIGINSKLVILLKALAPEKVNEEVLKSDVKLTMLLDSLKGKDCIITTGVNEKGFDFIDSVTSVPGDDDDQPPVAKFEEVEESALIEEEDDIPF